MPSEEIVTPLGNLDDNGELPPEPTPEPEPAKEPEPTPEPPKPAPQPNANDEALAGLRAALTAERERRQNLETELRALKTPPKPEVPDVSDDEAERYARHYELYTPQGLDISRAKRIIADQRAEMKRVAREAVQEYDQTTVAEVRQTAAQRAAREQFVRVATAKDEGGQALFNEQTVKVLAEEFAKLPPELSSQPEVADHVMNAALGKIARSRKPAPAKPEREPVFTESSSGPRPNGYTISNLEKNVANSRGISHSDWEKTAKQYVPGQPNVLE